MVMANVQFLFDFGSPNAFLAERVVPDIEKRTGAKFERVPVLLGGIFKATGNKSPAEAFGAVANKMAYERLETERFNKRHRIADYKFNPFFPVNTLLIMRGAVAAQIDGVLPKYQDAVYRAMWVEPKKMDDPEVVRAVLTQAGFDAGRLLARTQDADVKAKLMANTEDAVARGAFGIPTFFVGKDIFFGKDRLRDVEEAIVGST
jgi:2-hydroxychromene-2-carboxylate isomerase